MREGRFPMRPVPFLILLALALPLAGCVEGNESTGDAGGFDDAGTGPRPLDETATGEGDAEGRGAGGAGGGAGGGVQGDAQSSLVDDGSGPTVPDANAPTRELPAVTVAPGQAYERAFLFPEASQRVDLLADVQNEGSTDATLTASLTSSAGGRDAEETITVPAGGSALVRLTLEGAGLEGQESGVELGLRMEATAPLFVSGSFYLDGTDGAASS